MKRSKLALFQSLIALLLCCSMLVGTTFAWFTDSVASGINMIAAGNLDVELFHSNAAVRDEQVDADTKLFLDLQGNPILWEPGAVSYENLRVANAGNLALAYQLAINTANENFVVDASGAKYGLSQILKVGFVDGGITSTDRAEVISSVESANWTTLADFVRSGSLLPEGTDQSEQTWGVVIYWEAGENDNLWNLSNGKQLNEGDALKIDLGIKLIATQEQYESDAFGKDYDANVKTDFFPVFTGSGSVSTPVVPNDQNQVASDVVLTSGQITASIPAGVQLADGTTELTMSVSEMEESGANITLEANEAMRSLDVHIEGVSNDNTVPMEIYIKEAAPKGLNMGNYKLYHVENGVSNEMTAVDTFTAHNQFKYDPATGDITLYMATFSEVAVVANTTKAWEGKFDYSWYDASKAELTIANADQLAAFGAIVGGMKKVTDKTNEGYTYSDDVIQDSFNGKTVKLIADINLDDAEESNKSFIFYPIGYYNSDGTYEKTGTAITSGLRNFEGTFDGQGHTISNFYQNTWEMKGDNEYYDASEQYYRDGMGLFGKVYGGTVKNLTVKNFKSDGEYTTTGVIAAYADGATFENIAIVDCNPRVYNIGNGGIVGCVGWYAKEANLKTTFKNITVDNSNKISALWGSYDVACGGIVGQYYPTSGQTSAGSPKNAGINFDNCHISAQLDVYNDVCGNYQYYAYRYAGMMIGSIRENLPADENGHIYPDMTGITASNCTVNYGDWNDYYYCEFVKNGHPSYSGPNDYKFSRVPNSEIDTSAGKENATCIGHNHTDVEDNQAIYLPFDQLFTGYGWGVTSKGVKDFVGIDTINVGYGDQEESVEKFAVVLSADTTLEKDKEISVGSLFKAIDGAKINSSAVQVSVSAMNGSEIVGTYEANTSDWTKGTLTFNEVEGMCTVTIQDYNFCKPTSFVLKDGKLYNIEKFSKLFTNSFLYRVGNANEVALSSLFASVNGDPVGAVAVSVENVSGNATGAYTANNGWENGKIQFSGTGVVKVTIKDEDVSGIPTELMLEVIDAWNATTKAESAPYKYNGVNYNVVLLNDIKNGSFTVSGDYGFYGNGFTVTLNPSSHTTKRGAGFDGYIHMNGGTLDNVRIEGPTFAAANIYREQGQTGTGADDPVNYFRNGVIIDSGDAKIINSYLSGARTALYVKGGGDVVVENTTVSGGAYANIEVSVANSVTLKNVTTVQKETKDSYGQNKNMIGISIVIDNAETKLILNGLTQYNWMTQAQWDGMLGTYKSQFPALFTATAYTDLWHKNTAGTKVVNTGIIYACDVTELKTEGSIPGYDKTKISVASTNGYVYTLENGGDTNKVIDETSKPDYEANNQTAIPPVATFDYTTKNYQPYVDGQDEYCYYDTGVVKIGFTKGQSKAWDPMILSIKKNDKTITDYKVTLNNTDYTNKTITFTEGRNYQVVYTYTDPYNYRYSGNKLVSYSVDYEEVVNITVNVTEEQAKNAEFTMNGKAVEKFQIGDKTYLSATGVNVSALTKSASFSNSPVSGSLKHNYDNTSRTGWGCLTISGQTIYFPIVPMLTTDGTFNHTGSWYGCFPVFEGIIEIKDYANQGTAKTPTVYNDDTTTMPTTLKALDPQNYFVYQGTASKVPTTPSKMTKGGYKDKWCYTTQTDLTASNERGEVWTLATYTYTDNKGATYYWYVGYYCAASTNGGCVTPDTLVALADGTQKRIDQVTYEDQLLVWDFVNGEYVAMPSIVVKNHGYSNYRVLTLNFSDGSKVNVIAEHGFFDVAMNEFVMIDENNVADYIGHAFVQTAGDSYKTVRLMSYSIAEEYTAAYSILTAVHYNCVLGDMLTLTPNVIGGNYFMPFEVGKDMKFDAKKMQADIEKYGLFAYEEFADYVTEEQFYALNAPQVKVAVGKGIITMEQLYQIIEELIPKD